METADKEMVPAAIKLSQNIPYNAAVLSHGLSSQNHAESPFTYVVCHMIAARGLLVVHEWPVLIGHEGAARVVYQN